jgi:hypothetical protein
MRFLDLLSRIVLGLHATLLVACGTDNSSAKPIKITYDGDTDSTMYKFFNDLPNNSTVVINSKGGRESDAISIAEIVAKKSITIEVDRFCASACAQYIFIASKTRKIRDDAVVSFHINSFAAKKIGLTRSKKAGFDADRARKLYNDAGIDPQFMVYAALSVGPYCTLDNETGRQKYSAWVPSQRQLEKWKIKIDGPWFASKSDAMKTLSSIYRSGSLISYGDENESSFSAEVTKCAF